MDEQGEIEIKAFNVLTNKDYFIRTDFISALAEMVGRKKAEEVIGLFYNQGYFNVEDDWTIGTKERPAYPGSSEYFRR